ncbi:MAG: hypothetical protein KDK27_19205, partial [Leptospiraceae bacterium]|nr:hypothetical protein [Leptospiraceae bacterium]
MKKKLIIIGGAIVGLILVIFIGLWITIASILNEDFLVSQIESSMNCRAEIEDLDVSLFSAGSISIDGVKIGPRDDEANKGVPMSERTTELKNPLIASKSIDLSLSLMPLLSKRLELQRLVLTEPYLDLRIRPNGETNLSPLFETPKIVNGERNPALDAPPEPAEAEEEPADGEDKPFGASDIPIAGHLERIGIDNGELKLGLSSGDSLHVQGLDVFLTDIDVDPADLANHNSADLEINADVQLSDRAGNEKGMFLVRSTGTIVPFDPNQAGEFNTDVEYALTLLKGSRVGSFMVVNELMNALPEILKLAVDRDKLKGQAELTHDVNVVVKYNRGLLTFLNEPTFQTKRYDIGLRKGSWIRLTNSTHKFTGKLIATQEDSDKTIAKIDQELERVVKDKGKAQE